MKLLKTTDIIHHINFVAVVTLKQMAHIDCNWQRQELNKNKIYSSHPCCLGEELVIFGYP
jgi:hypothetical protein